MEYKHTLYIRTLHVHTCNNFVSSTQDLLVVQMLQLLFQLPAHTSTQC